MMAEDIKQRFVLVANKDEVTVLDTYKDIEYKCDIPTKLLNEVNQLHESRMRLKRTIAEQKDEISLWSDAVHGLLAVQELRQRARIFDTWER